MLPHERQPETGGHASSRSNTLLAANAAVSFRLRIAVMTESRSFGARTPVDFRPHLLHKIATRCVWLAAAVTAITPYFTASGADSPARPNFVIILADDFGYECVRANGGTSYRTPELDRLAVTGMRFEHCYVQPLCTPTRVQLMTGLYNVRNYITFGQMDPNAVTFAQLLKRAGYATCIAGKWQLGRDSTLPKRFGFDEYCLWQHLRRPPRYANPGLEINGVEKDFTGGQYGPDLVSDYACDFITRHEDGPFFLYYPMMLTHAPFQPTPDSSDWDPKAMGETVNRAPKHFADMVAYMDKLVGRVITRLDDLRIRDRTLILFVGDNGTGRGVRSMMGDRVVIGGKGSTTVSGMHVPLIANWPGKIPAGRVSQDLIDSTDFLPTLCDAGGAIPPFPLDGHSFYRQLLGERDASHVELLLVFPAGRTATGVCIQSDVPAGSRRHICSFRQLHRDQAAEPLPSRHRVCRRAPIAGDRT